MNKVKNLSKIIRNLFSSEEVTIIRAKDLIHIPLKKWQYINDKKIRYKIVKKNDNYVVSITEWLEDDTFWKHIHEDADETIFTIAGKITSTLENLERTTFGKISYKAGTIHEVKAKKGTLISVKFDFI